MRSGEINKDFSARPHCLQLYPRIGRCDLQHNVATAGNVVESWSDLCTYELDHDGQHVSRSTAVNSVAVAIVRSIQSFGARDV